jgi:hypothetical protein
MSRKTYLVLKLVLLSILFCLLLGLSAFFLLRGSLPSAGYGKLRVSAAFDDVEAVTVNGGACAVEVLEGAGDSLTVAYYQSGFLPSDPPQWEQAENTLTVTDQSHGIFSAGRIVLWVPAGDQLDYQIQTASGSVRLSMPSQEAEITTTTGSVKVYEGGGRLTVSTKTGSIKVYEPFQEQSLETKTGSIKSTLAETSTQCRAETNTGSVKLALRDVSGYTFTYDASVGSVKDEYHNISYDKQGVSTWGDGSLMLEVESDTGSVKLCDWD